MPAVAVMSQMKTRYKSYSDQKSSEQKQKLMSSLEENMNAEELYSQEDFDGGDLEAKVDIMLEAFNKLNARFGLVHDIINDAQDGLDTRVDMANDSAKDAGVKLDTLEDKNNLLCREVDLLKGIVIKYETENVNTQTEIDITNCRSMSNNVVISGITGDKGDRKEKCKDKIESFLKNTLKINFEKRHIQVAHRLGEFVNDDNPRAMVVKCHSDLKASIFKNVKNLKGQKNDQGKAYFVNKQLPDQWTEENRRKEGTNHPN